jgi:Ca2+-binding EF-hand superfamily protein
MLNAFKRLDADRSGFLEKHELEDVMRKITKGLGVEEPSNEDVDFIMK